MLGILLAVIAAICYGMSAVVQKYSMEVFDVFHIRQIIRHKIWILSMVIGLSGVLFYMSALTMTDLVVTQPILSISLLIHFIAGVTLFKEKLVFRQWIAIFLVILGIVLVSVS